VTDWVRNFSPQASSAMEGTTEINFGTRVAQEWGWCRNVECVQSACIVQRKRAMPHGTVKNRTCLTWGRFIDRTSVVVTALCNQPDAFALALRGDQSRYLLTNVSRNLWTLLLLNLQSVVLNVHTAFVFL